MIKESVLLIDPEGKSPGPNVALAYIHAYLKSVGIQVSVLDLNNLNGSSEIKDKILLQEIYRNSPSWIGYSLFYTNVKWATRQIQSIRKHYQGKIVVGGPQAILEQEQLLEAVPEIDVLSVSEGEPLSFELTKAFSNGTSLEHIDGIIFRNKDGKLVRNRERPLLRNLDKLPFPDFSYYSGHLAYYPVITSRGCPYECAFCFRSFRHDWRPRTPQNVIDEILHAREKYKFNKFIFHDDSFNLKPDRVIEICDLLIKNDIKMTWACAGIRADHITPTMADKMAESGCEQVNVGIETFDPEIFESLHKRESLEDIIKGIKIIKRTGIKVSAYLIIGLPKDTYEKTMDNVKKAEKLRLNRVSWTIFLPIPKTKYYDILKADSRVKWLEDYKDVDMVWLPRMKKMGVAFEYPDFSAKEKIHAYRKANAYLLTPLSHHQDSLWKYLVHTHIEMIRYAPWRIFKYWLSMLREISDKYRKGTLVDLLLSFKR